MSDYTPALRRDQRLDGKVALVTGAGSRADGNSFSPNDPDLTCGNWTRGGAEGAVMVGHHDRNGPTTDPWSTSWNSSHQSRGGCSPAALQSTGGAGLLYCFAVQ